MNKFASKVRAASHIAAKPVVDSTKQLRNNINTTATVLEAKDLSGDINETAARLVVLCERAETDPIDALATALVAHAEAKVKLADQAKKDADEALVNAIKNVVAQVPTVENTASVS
jgi:hypothetical protein